MAVHNIKKQNAEQPARPNLLITRVFDAPRELVWRTWSESEHLKKWWGPKRYAAPVIKLDFRLGGSYLFCMLSPEGREFWSTGVYREIVPHERIVCTDSFADANGVVVPASQYGMSGDWPQEMLITLTFEDLGGKTKLTLRHEGVPAGEMSDLTSAGWNESFDKLNHTLP
jgi:uncharacterized protein YndB with AHSA1/START domain